MSNQNEAYLAQQLIDQKASFEQQLIDQAAQFQAQLDQQKEEIIQLKQQLIDQAAQFQAQLDQQKEEINRQKEEIIQLRQQLIDQAAEFQGQLDRQQEEITAMRDRNRELRVSKRNVTRTLERTRFILRNLQAESAQRGLSLDAMTIQRDHFMNSFQTLVLAGDQIIGNCRQHWISIVNIMTQPDPQLPN